MADNDQKGFTVTDRRTVDSEGAVKEPAPKQPERAAPPPEMAEEIDFSTFAMSLASSALIHLGELSAPGERQVQRNFALAKQTIDILGMLADKTRGNLTAEEAKLLEHLVFDLRLKYVEAKKRQP